eukprot:scaffold338_cov361-Pavlova_lutheri.AAC.3
MTSSPVSQSTFLFGHAKRSVDKIPTRHSPKCKGAGPFVGKSCNGCVHKWEMCRFVNQSWVDAISILYGCTPRPQSPPRPLQPRLEQKIALGYCELEERGHSPTPPRTAGRAPWRTPADPPVADEASGRSTAVVYWLYDPRGPRNKLRFTWFLSLTERLWCSEVSLFSFPLPLPLSLSDHPPGRTWRRRGGIGIEKRRTRSRNAPLLGGNGVASEGGGVTHGHAYSLGWEPNAMSCAPRKRLRESIETVGRIHLPRTPFS